LWRGGGGGGAWVLPKVIVEVRGPSLEAYTSFQIKICDFHSPAPISDLSENSMPHV